MGMMEHRPRIGEPVAQVPKLAPPAILVLDDNWRHDHPAAEGVRALGYDVVCSQNVSDALAALAGRKFDLLVIDGNIGDKRWDRGSLAGQFIDAHVIGTGQRFIRLTGQPTKIDPAHAGEAVLDNDTKLGPWLRDNLPSTINQKNG